MCWGKSYHSIATFDNVRYYMTHDLGVDVGGTFTGAIVSGEDTHELATELILPTPEALSADVPDDGEVDSEATGARRAEPPDIRASRPVIKR